jgi:hypothetical protein
VAAQHEVLFPKLADVRHEFGRHVSSVSPICAVCESYCFYTSYYCVTCDSAYDIEGAGLKDVEKDEEYLEESKIYCALHLFDVRTSHYIIKSLCII